MSAAARARCWRSTRAPADLQRLRVSRQPARRAAITASEIAEPIRTSTSVKPRSQPRSPHRAAWSEWSAARAARRQPCRGWPSERPTKTVRTSVSSGSPACGTIDQRRTNAAPAAADPPRLARCRRRRGNPRSRRCVQSSATPAATAAGRCPVGRWIDGTGRCCRSERRLPAASTRHSSAANCSSFCCASQTAVDCVPADHDRPPGRTISRPATPVVIATTTASRPALRPARPSRPDERLASRPDADPAAASRHRRSLRGKAAGQPAGRNRRSRKTQPRCSAAPVRDSRRNCAESRNLRLSRRPARGCGSAAQRSASGSVNARRAPPSPGAIALDAAVVSHDDLLDQREAQPGAPGLGREEGTEHPFGDGRRDVQGRCR